MMICGMAIAGSAQKTATSVTMGVRHKRDSGPHDCNGVRCPHQVYETTRYASFTICDICPGSASIFYKVYLLHDTEE